MNAETQDRAESKVQPHGCFLALLAALEQLSRVKSCEEVRKILLLILLVDVNEVDDGKVTLIGQTRVLRDKLELETQLFAALVAEFLIGLF